MRGAAVTRTSFEVLLCRAGLHFCGLPLEAVSETMRRLPVSEFASSPAFVEGLSVVRGVPMPVVNLGRLLGQASSPPASRFVSLTTGSRALVLGVDEVVGVRRLDADDTELPPLLGAAHAQAVEALTTLDRELLLVLSSARLVPDSV